MEQVDEAVERLNAAMQEVPARRTGGLCFYGSWEGGRRGENWYVIEHVQAEGEALKLVLKGGQELLIHGFEGLDVWKTSFTIRAAERFVIRDGPGREREIGPPPKWPPHSAGVAFEFAI